MKWMNEKTYFEITKDRTSCHRWALYCIIMSIIYIISGLIISFNNSKYGIPLILIGIYFLIMFNGLIDKRDLYSFFIYLKSKEEK